MSVSFSKSTKAFLNSFYFSLFFLQHKNLSWKEKTKGDRRIIFFLKKEKDSMLNFFEVSFSYNFKKLVNSFVYD